MTYQGVVRGTSIQLSEPLPFPDGHPVTVRVENGEQSRRGAPAAILAAIRSMTPLADDDVDALERSIAEGRLPVRYDSAFDEEPR